MTKKNASDALRKLAAGTAARSATAMLRDIFDDIENAMRAGVRRKAILETLQEEGFKITFKSFESAIYRIRKQRKKAANKGVANQQEGEQKNVIEEQAPTVSSKSDKQEASPIKRSGLPIVRKKEVNLEDYMDSEDEKQ
ncbi:hypothetical protein ACR2R6_23450 (plasmid) [Methylocaldum gracile subsp. desertum]|uniref:hypothetical protein n=1 Tax=Methylocaldum sp. GT1BW TaxID=3438964 RepID=UPI003DA07EAD